MSKIDEAREILKDLQVPSKQYADLCCLAILAMAGIKEHDAWSNATNQWIRIHDVIQFAKDEYHREYAENSRETFRKQAMHHFRNAAFIEDNGLATNSPNYRYRLTDEMADLLRNYKSDQWAEKLTRFLANHENLISLYTSKKDKQKMPVQVNGEKYTFSPGKHNELQKAIIEVLPRALLLMQNVYTLEIPPKRIS